MSLANRRFLLHGRVMSEPGRVKEFQAPTRGREVQDKTGPFNTSPTRKGSGFKRFGDLTTSLWTEADLDALITAIYDTGLDPLCAWTTEGDATGAEWEAGSMLSVEVNPVSDLALVTDYGLVLQVDENGVEDCELMHAMAEEAGDGNTEADPVDNGYAAAAVNITSSSVASPTVITAAAAHGLQTGDTVEIAGHSGSTPDINGSHVVTVTSTTEFTIAVNVTVGGTGGTVRRSSTRNGGAAHLHVDGLELDSGTGCQVKAVHSVDGSTWVDLVSFTNLTSEIDAADPADSTAERKPITGDIDRYTALDWAFGGSPGGSEAITLAGLIHRSEQV